METVAKNSTKAWLLAARPKTLAAGSVPVLVASALAASMGRFQLVPAVLCLLFALLAQVASNFANDYFDFVKKTDNEDRLGPARAVASGWIDPHQMLIGLAVTITVACLFGLGLIYYGGWAMVLVGVVSVISLLAYTAGPWPLAYHGLGDLFVLVFFGFVAVVFTYYVQTGSFHPYAFVTGAMVGLQAVNILVLNNYRDRDTDRASGKKTTIVLLGEPFGRWFYLANGFSACLLGFLLWPVSFWAALLPLLYLWPHYTTWRKLVAIRQGKALNSLLWETSRNLLLLGLLISIGLLI
ncbi:MAG: 1,4-dihydroxy-2-naphthoate octaprenyltransferase [Bacteroidetes bacterium ADurb.Bin416]|nr:MAG: 1,4-dihydroxy-2-naphthoate octaprenyltransferase [Bacteroidetes bacterium ADurb.Bin416]